MKGLTDKQRNMLDFIEEFQSENCMAPTVYEIGEYFDIKTATVFAHLKSLQRKGYLTRSSKARSICLQQPFNKRPSHVSFVLSVPLLGRISAGLPLDSPELKEGEVYCDTRFIENTANSEVFALKINGESMKDLGILDGDVVIVKKDSNIREGDIVVALIETETTVKSYYMAKEKIELRPANKEFRSQLFDPELVQIQGRVIALQRRI